MLYERWRQIARDQRDETALCDLATRHRWTFGQLATAAEAGPGTGEPWAFPHGIGADFVFTVLRAWRDGNVVCPCETGQQPPHFERGGRRCCAGS